VFASSEFWGGTSLIPIFCSGFFMVFLYSFPVNFEFYNKKTKIIASGTVAAAICNIILNVLMIRSLGVMGVALATTIAHGLQFVFHHICAKYFVNKGNYPHSLKFFLPHTFVYLLFAIFCYFIQDNYWILRWGIGAIIGIWELKKMMKRRAIF